MTTSTLIRVLIIDDHSLVCTGLHMLLESQPGITVVGEASNRSDALAATVRELPDIILLDLDLGVDSGADLIPELLAAASQARVLILTGTRDPELHHRAVRHGAMGLVLKENAADILVQAIARVHAGESWLTPTMMASVLDDMRREREVQQSTPEEVNIARITPREREVIALIGEGLKNKQIAARMFISETTVRHHLTAIFAKLGVADRLELVVYSYQHNLHTLFSQSCLSRPLGLADSSLVVSSSANRP